MEQYFAAKKTPFRAPPEEDGSAVIVHETAEGRSAWGERLAALLPDRRVFPLRFLHAMRGAGRDLVQAARPGSAACCTSATNKVPFPRRSPAATAYSISWPRPPQPWPRPAGRADPHRTRAGGPRANRLERVTLAEGAGAARPTRVRRLRPHPGCTGERARGACARSPPAGSSACSAPAAVTATRGKRPLMGAIAARPGRCGHRHLGQPAHRGPGDDRRRGRYRGGGHGVDNCTG